MNKNINKLFQDLTQSNTILGLKPKIDIHNAFKGDILCIFLSKGNKCYCSYKDLKPHWYYPSLGKAPEPDKWKICSLDVGFKFTNHEMSGRLRGKG